MKKKLNEQSHLLNQNQIRLSRVQASFGPSLEFFLSTSMVILFGMGSMISVGTLVAMQRYLQKLMWPMSAVGMAIIYFQKAKSSGESFYQFLEEPRSESLGSNEAEVNALSKCIEDEKSPVLEAKNLSFGVIQNLSFQVFKGEWLGVDGRVASGKSTLLALLLKFYDLPRGQLFVEGKDINDWRPELLRMKLSSVLQDPYLFRGSIQSNLDIGDELELERALEVAQVTGVLAEGRLNEELGEKGSGLSGGQKQRVAIARALRKGSPVLLLDDPLSSVDLKTAEMVLKNLHQTTKDLKKTVVFVSHHPEHLLFCDRIVTLNPGENSR